MRVLTVVLGAALVALTCCLACHEPPRSPATILCVEAAAEGSATGIEALTYAAHTPPLLEGKVDDLGAKFAWRISKLEAILGDPLPAGIDPATGTVDVAFVVVDRAPTSSIVSVTASGTRPFAFLLHQPVGAPMPQADDAAAVAATLEGERSNIEWLRPGTDPHRVTAVTRAARADATKTLIGVVASPAATLSVVPDSPYATFLRTTSVAGRPSFSRRIEVDKDLRDALVLPTGGTLRVPLAIPGDDPVFRAAVAVAGPGRGDAGIVATVRARAAHSDREIVAEVTARPNMWTPLGFDLSALAGADAVLEFRASAIGDASDLVLAFGQPRIEPRAVDGTRQPRLDVVLVSLDTVRHDRTQLADPNLRTSPRLLDLAEHGVSFDVAASTAPWTLPSHAAALTGQLQDRMGLARAHTQALAADAPLLAVDFAAAGYETVAFTGGGFMSADFGFDRGFERLVRTDPAHPDPMSAQERPGRKPELMHRARQSMRSRAELIALLRTPSERPRFVFVHSYAAHEYFTNETDLLAVGASEDDAPRIQQAVDEFRSTLGAAGREEWAPSARIAYDSCIRQVDRLLGDVVDATAAAGRLDKTVFVAFSDHGEEFLERGGYGHASKSLYDELTRVVFVVRAPGVAPRRIDDLVSLADLAPTIRELAGIAPPAGAPIDGRSLVPYLAGRDMEAKPAYASANFRGDVRRFLRSRSHKLVRLDPRNGAPRLELYDLIRDPGERHDLSASRRELAVQLDAQLAAFAATLTLSPNAIGDATVGADTARQLEELGYVGGK